MTNPDANADRMSDGTANATPNSPTPLFPSSPAPTVLAVSRGVSINQSQNVKAVEDERVASDLSRGELWLLAIAGLSAGERMAPRPKSKKPNGLVLVPREIAILQGWFRKFVGEDENGCWIWHGAKFPSGYGACGFRGTTTVAHRAIWQILVCDLPRSLDLDHLCRVRECVNPDHLEPVTRSINLTRGAHPTQGRLGRTA